MNEQLEQRVARAIAEVAGYGPGFGRQEDRDHAQEYYRAHAKAALKAHSDWLAEQGLAVVPREPSKEMCKAGASAMQAESGDAEVCWETMVSTT